MNNNNVGGKNYPLGYAPPHPDAPQQPVRPVYQQPVRPVYQQPVPAPQSVRSQQPVMQQPVQSVPQPVRPVYQQPFPVPQPVVRPTPQFTTHAQEAVGSMNKALFVILSVLFGWICSRSLFSFDLGIGMTVMGISFYLIYLPFILFKQKKSFSLFGWLLFVPQIIILASFTFFSEIRVVIVGLLASFLIAAVQTTLLSNCTTGKPFTLREAPSVTLASPSAVTGASSLVSLSIAVGPIRVFP